MYSNLHNTQNKHFEGKEGQGVSGWALVKLAQLYELHANHSKPAQLFHSVYGAYKRWLSLMVALSLSTPRFGHSLFSAAKIGT